MNEKQLYLILKAFNYNINVKQLTREGLTFPEIADLMAFSIKEGFLIHTPEMIKLSEKGSTTFFELEKKYKVVRKDEWIDAENKSKIPKLEEDFIFLPNQNEIHF